MFTSLIYPPIVSPSNGRILSKLALFERQWMATLSVGREEMYTQPVSAERIRPIENTDPTSSRNTFLQLRADDGLVLGQVGGVANGRRDASEQFATKIEVSSVRCWTLE